MHDSGLLLKFPIRIRESLFTTHKSDACLQAVSCSGPRCSLQCRTEYRRDLSALYEDFLRSRHDALKIALEDGCGIMASSSHPFSDWRSISASEGNYSQRRALVNTMTIDIQTDSVDEILSYSSQLDLLTLLAIPLTASSPFWNGKNSGYDSVVYTVCGESPLSALYSVPSVVANHLAARNSGFPLPRILDKPAAPVELSEDGRVLSIRCDVVTDERHVFDWLKIILEVLETPPPFASQLSRGLNDLAYKENYWRAGKSGFNAIFLAADGSTIAMRDMLTYLTDRCTLVSLDKSGNSAQRQREVFEARKRQGYPDASAFSDVAHWLMIQTCSNHPRTEDWLS